MQRLFLHLLALTLTAFALVTPSTTCCRVSRRNNIATRNTPCMLAASPKDENEVPDEDQQQQAPKSDRYDVSKLVGAADDGAGFNQFDPVLKATGFMSRRFGLIGGLAIFGVLAAVEGREILNSISDQSPLVGSGETVTSSTGLKVTEVLVGKSGSTPLPGSVIGIKARVSIGGEKVIFDTAGDKPIAFKLGQRPFQSVICEGVEEGIRGMKVGGKRLLEVPANLAPPGVDLPPGVVLNYEIELTEVLPGYF